MQVEREMPNEDKEVTRNVGDGVCDHVGDNICMLLEHWEVTVVIEIVVGE